MTRRIAAVAITACFAVVVTPALARHQKKNTAEPIFDQHAVVYGTTPRTERRDIRSRVRTTSASFGVQGDPRPHRWCGWYLRRELGVPIRAFPKWSQNIAAAWRHVGSPASGPAVGVVVVWPRHVGYITRRTSTGWVVKSGNDGGAVRERERSLRGVIAYRWVNRIASKPRKVTAALPPQRERKSQPRVLQSPPWTMTAAYVEPDFEYAIEPSPLRPAPITTWGDRVGIFQRYFESKDVVVAQHTSLTCPNGQPFPARLAQLPKDAAAHFGRTAYINSGYRTPERNRRVGGAKNSEHKKCKAIDWRVAGISVLDLRRWVMARLNQYGIGGLGTYGTHLHTDARKATRLVTWTGGRKKSVTRYAKHRKPSRYASAG